MNKIVQAIIIVLGFVAVVYGIKKLAAGMTNLIFPPWLLVSVVALAIITLSMAFGYTIKSLLKTRWLTVTFAAAIVVIVVVVYTLVGK